MEQTGADFSRAWRCPAAGHKPGPLSRELDSLQQAAARVMGVEPPGTCPFACLESADDYVREMSRAFAVSKEFHTPLPDVLGRPLTAVDIEAADAVLRAQADAWQSDQAIIEAEREAARKKPPHG